VSRTGGAGVAGLVLTIAFASIVDADSGYSVRGFGEPVLSSEASVRGRGGAEAAGSTPSLAGNPASLAFALETRFTGSYETEWIRTQEPLGAGGQKVRKEYDNLIPNLSLVYPLPRGLRLGTGLLVGRRKGGTIARDTTTVDGQSYRQVFEATGNVLRIPVLFAHERWGTQFGTGLDVLLLNQEVLWENDFPAESGFGDSRDFDRLSLWGVAFRAGVRKSLGSRVAAGAWISLPSELSGSRRLENVDVLGGSEEVKLDREGEVAERYGLGLEIRPLEDVLLTADWVHEAWEGTDGLSPIDELVDVNRFAAGFEWVLSARGRGPSLPIRGGWRTELLHVLDNESREVREHVLTAGSGFGFAGGRGTIDAFFEYGWRGTKDDTEYYEQFVRFGLTLTGVEKWTRRRSPEEEEEGDW
jgi:hypothetical protein